MAENQTKDAVEETNTVTQNTINTETKDAVEETNAPAVAAEGTQEATTAAPKVVTPAPTPTAKAQVSTAAKVVSNTFDSMVAAIKTNGSDFQKNLLTVLETYVEEMAPGKRHTEDTGAMKQYTLWIAIRNAVNDAPVEEFRNLWTMILAFFEKYAEGVFHERYVFRFSEHWRWAKQELDGFQHILNLIKLTADPKSRALGLKRIDLNRALVLPITDDGRQRLLNFYR